jgi:hypothetical protein
MKKTTITLLFIGLFASLMLLSGALASPVAASPVGETLTPSPTSVIIPPNPTKVVVVDPGQGGSPILPETGELPPGPEGLGTWVLPGLGVLLVAGLIGLAVGFAAGDKLRK